MDDVAKEAEFSKRTLYLYFNSKEQLYFEIMARGYRRLIGMLNEDTERENGDAVGKIRRMAWTLYRFSREQLPYFRAIMEYETGERDFQKGIPDASREECYALGEALLGHLVGALKQGIAERSVRKDLDAEKTALVLWACIVGAFSIAGKKENYLKNYHAVTPEELVSATFELTLRSIRVEDGGNRL